jgi:hypothetical protein
MASETEPSTVLYADLIGYVSGRIILPQSGLLERTIQCIFSQTSHILMDTQEISSKLITSRAYFQDVHRMPLVSGY